MATVFKTFLNNDIKSTRTLLHEAIPLTGSLVSGTYGTFPNGDNIKNYAHGMFQSVYDYPYLSSSANHIFDLTVGYSTASALSASDPSAGGPTPRVQQAKKINMYNQMAGTMMGYDASGSVILFDEDGDLTNTGAKINDAVFINFARLLQKDEIKKGSFTLKIGPNNGYNSAMNNGAPPPVLLTITDNNAENNYRTNAAVGDYAILTCSVGGAFGGDKSKAGLLFYQAGVVVLTASIFQDGANGVLDPAIVPGGSIMINQASDPRISDALTGTAISGCCDAFRHRIYDIAFNNTTELNSTIHFCRINNSEFNYSSNPTYLSESKIVVKNTQLDAPVSYFTTVGLYSADNELLAVAKLSEPLKKDPTNEMIVRVRLDY